MFSNSLGNFGDVKVVFNEYSARISDKNFPDKINEYTISAHPDDKEKLIELINNFKPSN